MQKQTRLFQLVLLNVAFGFFLLMASAAGWLYTRGDETDLVRWLPVVAIGNGFVVAALGASPNRGSWPRRILGLIPYVVAACLTWYAIAFVARQLLNWPAVHAAIAGQFGSFIAIFVITVKQLSDGYAAEDREAAIQTLQRQLDELKTQTGNPNKRGSKKKRR